MASRKLKAEVMFEDYSNPGQGATPVKPYTVVTLRFNRKLTSLERSGIKAVMDGDI